MRFSHSCAQKGFLEGDGCTRAEAWQLLQSPASSLTPLRSHGPGPWEHGRRPPCACACAIGLGVAARLRVAGHGARTSQTLQTPLPPRALFPRRSSRLSSASCSCLHLQTCQRGLQTPSHWLGPGSDGRAASVSCGLSSTAREGAQPQRQEHCSSTRGSDTSKTTAASASCWCVMGSDQAQG